MEPFISYSMRVRCFLAGLSCLICLPLGAAFAEKQHDLDSLIVSALKHSPSLEAFRAQIDVSHAKEANLSWWDAPELRVGYGRDAKVAEAFRSAQDPNHEYDAALRIFPRNPWVRRATRKKLQAEARLQGSFLAEAEMGVSSQVKGLYWDFVYTLAESELHKQLTEIYQDQVTGTEALLESGQIAIGQTLPAKMKQLDSVLELKLYERQISDLLGALSKLTGLKKESIHAVRPIELSQAAFQFSEDTWDARALEHRIELKQSDDAIMHTQQELKEIRAENVPWVKHVQGNYEVRNEYGERDSAGIEIALTLPFFTTQDGAKKVALTTLESQRRERSHHIRVIRAEVRDLVDQFAALKKQWSAQQHEIAPLKDALSESVELMERQGVSGNRNYWDARVALLELSKKELKAAYTYQKLLLRAERVLGEPLVR